MKATGIGVVIAIGLGGRAEWPHVPDEGPAINSCLHTQQHGE